MSCTICFVGLQVISACGSNSFNLNTNQVLDIWLLNDLFSERACYGGLAVEICQVEHGLIYEFR